MKMPQMIEAVLAEHPHATNDEIADIINKRWHRDTTGASVGSTRSRNKNRVSNGVNGVSNDGLTGFSAEPMPSWLEEDEETDEERSIRIRKRYNTLERMADRLVTLSSKEIPSMIVSGPPGLGKSYTIEMMVRNNKDEHNSRILSGTISPVGLYMALWDMRDNGILVLDDCDDVFRDETSLNLLKAVLDSSEVRRISYAKEANWLEKHDIPKEFEFEGTVVFCTNLDFEFYINRGNAMSPHFSALMDRSMYLSLGMKSSKDYLCRLYQVGIEDKLLNNKFGISDEEAIMLYNFIERNQKGFSTISLRLLLHVGRSYILDSENWEQDVLATKMRGDWRLKLEEEKDEDDDEE